MADEHDDFDNDGGGEEATSQEGAVAVATRPADAHWRDLVDHMKATGSSLERCQAMENYCRQFEKTHKVEPTAGDLFDWMEDGGIPQHGTVEKAGKWVRGDGYILPRPGLTAEEESENREAVWIAKERSWNEERGGLQAEVRRLKARLAHVESMVDETRLRGSEPLPSVARTLPPSTIKRHAVTSDVKPPEEAVVRRGPGRPKGSGNKKHGGPADGPPPETDGTPA